MLGNLFIKECKMWLKSIVFYAYIIILFLFYVTNMDETLVKPKEGMQNYGDTYSEDENVIMDAALEKLIYDLDRNTFITYPMGFYKEVKLSDSDIKAVEKCISELTGLDEEEWKDEFDKYNEGFSSEYNEDGELVNNEGTEWNLKVADNITFSEFKKIMKKVTKVVGRGSDYEEEKLKGNVHIKKTYEQAMDEYNEIIEKDKVTNASARMFCDYIGIMLGILPAFFAVTRVIKEKRSKVSDVVFSKKANGTVIVCARYFAMLAMMFIPVVLVSMFSMAQSVYVASNLGIVPDYFAHIKYSIGWLLPTIMFVSALSYMIAEFTENVLSILISIAVWFVAMFLSLSGSMLINAGWNLIPRFNHFGYYHIYKEMFPQLVKNRCFYAACSIVLVFMVVAVYNLKRNGGLNKWKKQ